MSNNMYRAVHDETPRCQHIFDTNLQCKSPSLRGQDFCYWHEKDRLHREKFTVPLLETEHAIQATLSQVLRELYGGTLDTKRANAIFYGLSLAMFNVRNMSRSTDRDHIIDLPPAMTHVFAPIDGSEIGVAASPETTHEAWKNGASAPRCSPETDGLQPPCDAPPSDDSINELPPSSPRPSLPPEHFASPASLDLSGPFRLREQRFTKDEIHAYWTQHLPADVRDLRTEDGELFFEPHDWLPLTQEEIEYLNQHLPAIGDIDDKPGLWNQNRLSLHFSRLNIRPPRPEQLVRDHEELEKFSPKSLQEAFSPKMIKRAVKLAFGD